MYEPAPHPQRVLPKNFRELDGQKNKVHRKHWSQNFIDFENNKFLARTPLSWLKILVFYIIFFSILLGFWMSVFLVFERSLNATMPTLLLKSPGLSFAPALDAYNLHQTIEYEREKYMDFADYVENINKFLEKYVQNASRLFPECNEDGQWGYYDGSPCVFIKINRILGWKAFQTNSKPLPLEYPLELAYYIKSLPYSERDDKIWIHCQAENHQVDFRYFEDPYVLVHHVEYDEMKYYAEKDQDRNFLVPVNQYFYSPSDIRRVVAVKLINIPMNTRFTVKCDAYAPNFYHRKKKRSDSMVQFQVFIS